MTGSRGARGVARVGLLAALALAPAAAGAQASPYVPLDDVAYAFVDALQARGLLRSLSLTERPYTARSLARAVAESGTHTGVVGHWLDRLRARADRHLPHRPGDTTAARRGAPGLLAALGGRGTAQSASRDALPLADEDAGLHAGWQLRLGATWRPVVIAGRYLVDQRRADDPDYLGPARSGVAGRVEEGYLAGQWRYGELFVGRIGRNWGPAPLPGLQLAAAPFSYDHLLGRIGTERLRLATLVARLDDGPGTAAPRVRRHFAAHRLALRWRELEVAATESWVYSGPGRRLAPAVLVPAWPLTATHYQEDRRGNLTSGVEAAWRSRWGILGVQGMLDDYQFESGTAATEEPPSYGVTASLEGAPLGGAQRWFASYTRVANLTYRTPERGDAYTMRGVSLGRAFADHDETRLGVDLAVLPWAPVRLYALRRRQGEGDYRRAFPAIADYPTTPEFLSGRVATVTRIGVETSGAAGGLTWRLDGGYNRVAGAGLPIAAASGETALAGSGLAGRLTVAWEPGVVRRAVPRD